MKKIWYFIEFFIAGFIIIYTDYNINVGIIKQILFWTILIKKFNLRFIRIFEYFQRFPFNIYYKFGKSYYISDVLLKLVIIRFIEHEKIKKKNRKKEFDILCIYIYAVNLIKINPEFKIRIVEDYKKNPAWIKIGNILDMNIKAEDSFTFFFIRKYDGLI